MECYFIWSFAELIKLLLLEADNHHLLVIQAFHQQDCYIKIHCQAHQELQTVLSLWAMTCENKLGIIIKLTRQLKTPELICYLFVISLKSNLQSNSHLFDGMKTVALQFYRILNISGLTITLKILSTTTTIAVRIMAIFITLYWIPSFLTLPNTSSRYVKRRQVQEIKIWIKSIMKSKFMFFMKSVEKGFHLFFSMWVI